MAEPEGTEKKTPGPKGVAAIFGRPAPTRRQLLLGGGHLAALWALAFVQPLLDVLGKNPDFFVARNNTPGDILILAIGFTLLPPLILLAIEWVASKVSAKLYQGVHFAFLGLIALFFFIQLIGSRLGSSSALITLVALLLGAALAWGIFRFTFLRNLMDILILAPVVILLLFVFASKSSDVIFPKDSGVVLAKDSGDDRPIVLVIYDELGTANLMTDRNRIDGQRFPNFARLAKTSTWYKNQSTNAFLTPMAVPGILTGIDRPADALPTWQARPQSIFTQFARGRKVHVQEPVTDVCPPVVCGADADKQGQTSRLKSLWSDLKIVEGRLVLPPGIAQKLPAVDTNFQGFGAGESDEVSGEKAAKPDDGLIRKKGRLFVKAWSNGSPEEYRQFIAGMPKAKRSLTVMHMSLPHTSWRYDTKGRKYNNSPIDTLSDGIKEWEVDGNGIATAQARMLTQTAFADRLLGEIRSELEGQGLWDKAIVVVAADHGISFAGGTEPQRVMDPRSIGEVANPPLFIKYPDQKQGEVSEVHSTTFDIVPTIARAAGVKKIYPTTGVPLQGPVPDREVKLTDTTGKVVTASVQTMIEQRNAAITRANRRLGTGPIYTLGSDPELIGDRVPPVPSGAASATLDGSALWNNYRPDAARIPIFVTGTLGANVAPGTMVAVAVNGRIRGTGTSFEFKDANRFGALVAPDSLKPGRNEIGIYEVEPLGGLVPLGSN